MYNNKSTLIIKCISLTAVLLVHIRLIVPAEKILKNVSVDIAYNQKCVS